MADSAIKKGMTVIFKKDSAAYTAPTSSKKTFDIVRKGSRAMCDKVSGSYARLIVNEESNIKRWFKTSDLEETDKWSKVVWVMGGKDMTDVSYRSYEPRFKGLFVKVTALTYLRKTPSMHGNIQGIIQKNVKLKLTGYRGIDDMNVNWLGVYHNGKKRFVCSEFLKHHSGKNSLAVMFYDKNGNVVNPYGD